MAERAGGRAVLRKVGVALGAVVGLVVVAVVALVLLLQTGAVSRRVKDLVVPQVSAALGREVTVADARLRVFPSPRVALAGATIAGRPGEPPLAKLESLDVGVALWPIVRSLGKDVRVEGLALVRPEINLVRGRDGRWNYEGLGSKDAAASKPAGAAAPQEQGAGGGAQVVVRDARIEDGALRIVDRSQGRDDAAVALTRIDLRAEGGIGARTAAKLTAALAAPEKNVTVDLDCPRLEVGPGKFPELTGRLALAGIPLQRLRGLLPADVAGMFTGGRVDVDARIRSEPGGKAYLLDGQGKLAELKLRGEPASGSFELHGRADPAAGTAHVELTNVVVKGPGVDAGATATLDAKPLRARFAVKGALLDVGTVLGLVPQGPAGAGKPSATPEGALLPPAMAREVGDADVAGTIDLAKVVNGKLTATNLHARAVLKGGVLALEQASAELYGGRMDAGGTKVALADLHPKWNLKAKLESVDLGAAMSAISGAAPVTGRATGTLDLSGVGSNWDQLRNVLTGLGAFSLKDGALTTTDLGGQALGAIAQGLERVGKGGAAKRLAGLENGRTTLRDLAASFAVKDGFLALSKPLAFATAAGEAKLGGKIGLAAQLALDGTLAVSREALARAGLPPLGGAALNLPLALGGTLGSPSVQFRAEDALRGAVSGVVAEQKKALQEGVKRQARRRAEGLLRGLGK